MRPFLDRRAFLARGALLAAGAWLPDRAGAQNGKTRLILLGTGGGPRPRRASSASAQVIVAKGSAYVIDCGNGVARQLVFAGVPLTSLRHDDPAITDRMWVDAASVRFKGRVMVGKDLLEI
jgi:hypothetical protein